MHQTDRWTDRPQLIPRQESWGLTHRLGDSQSSHLCAFVCVRPSVTGCTALIQWLCFLLLLLPSKHTHRRGAQLRPSLQGQANQDTPGNRLALTLALIPRPRTFRNPSSPVKELPRLSLRKPPPALQEKSPASRPTCGTQSHLGVRSLPHLLSDLKNSPTACLLLPISRPVGSN